MDNFEFLETYPNLANAEVNANLLKSQGIKVLVVPNETGGALLSDGMPTGPRELWVENGKLTEARELLHIRRDA